MKGSLKINTKETDRRLRRLAAKSPSAFKQAEKVGALQFLTWANTGTGKSSRKPPIRYGVLRGSSSAFVGNEVVSVFNQQIRSGAPEQPSPLREYAGKRHVLTWVWNTEYATIQHEKKHNPGKYTAQDGDAGMKWVEAHLDADRELLWDVIAREAKKRMGT